MSFARAVFWNTVIQFSGRAVSTLLGLFVFALMARALGPENYGAYTIIISFLQFFAMLVDFGLALIGNRLAGEAQTKDEESKIFSNLLTIRFLSATAFFILAILIGFLFFPYSLMVKKGFIIVAPSFLFLALIQNLTPIFQKKLRIDRVILAEILGRVVLFGLVFLCVKLNLSFFYFLWAISLSSFFNFLLLQKFAQKFINLKFAFNWDLWKKIFSLSWPIALSIIFNLMYLKTDTLILSLFRPQEEVGFYGAAYKVLDIFTGLATAFMGFLLPRFTFLWVQAEKEKFFSLFQKTFDSISYLVFLILAIGYFLSPPIMVFLAGKHFLPAGKILSLLLIALWAVFYSTFFGHLIVVLNQQKKMIFAFAATAILTLGVYFFAIPRYGLRGAIAGTIFSEFFITFLTGFMVFKTTKYPLKLLNFFKAFLAALLTSFFLVVTRGWSFWLSGLLGCIIYVSFLFLSKALDKNLIKSLFKFS